MTLDTFNLVLIGIFVGFILIVLGFVLLIMTQQYKNLKLSKLNPQRRRFLMVGGLAVVGAVIGRITIERFITQQNTAVVICNGWIVKENELNTDVCESTTIR